VGATPSRWSFSSVSNLKVIGGLMPLVALRGGGNCGQPPFTLLKRSTIHCRVRGGCGRVF